jgi:hypothetical protein
MPIKAFAIGNWTTQKKLQKGDAEAGLEFEEHINRLIIQHGAKEFLDDSYVGESPHDIRAEIMRLEKRERDYHQHTPGSTPLTDSEAGYLGRQISKLSTLTRENTSMTRACGPIKEFIDTHIDHLLTNDIKAVATDIQIQLYEQIRRCRAIIQSKCCGDPTTTREMLMRRFEMGTAQSPDEVMTALDNIGILQEQLTAHHRAVTRSIDEEATATARQTLPWPALGPPPPIFKECLPPPRRFLRLGISARDSGGDRAIGEARSRFKG